MLRKLFCNYCFINILTAIILVFLLTHTPSSPCLAAGVVHQAPAFGEDDYRVCLAHNIIEKGEGIPCPVDLNGRFTEEVTDFAGRCGHDWCRET